MNTFIKRSKYFSLLFITKVPGEIILAIAVLALLLLLPLGQLQQLPISDVLATFGFENTKIRVYAHDVLIAVGLLTSILIHPDFISKYFKLLKSQRLLMLWGTWLIISVLSSSFLLDSLVPILYIVRLFFYAIFLVCVSHIVKDSQHLRMLMVISLLYLALLALLQYILLPDVRFLAALGWDDHYYRLTGSLFDPNFTGSLLILLLWGLFTLTKKLPTWLMIAGVLGIIGLILLTFSRASYLALIGSTIFVVWRYRYLFSHTKAIAGLIVVFITLFTVWQISPKPGGEGVQLLRTSSIQARVENTLAPMLQMEPLQLILGRGLFRSPAANQFWIPDNLVILILVGTGGIGLFLTLVLFKQWWKIIEKNTWLAAMWITVLTHAQFNNTLLEPFHVLYLGLFTIALLQQGEVRPQEATRKLRST